jgi:excisionase family DNA binding protein
MPAEALAERRLVVSINEAAERLGVHRETIRRALVRGELPAQRIGDLWLIPRRALEALEAGRDPWAEQ